MHTNFRERFNRAQKRAERMQKIVWTFIILVMIVMLTLMVVLGWATFNVIDAVADEGVKGLVERLWEGGWSDA